MITIRTPWQDPPIRQNDRLNPFARARVVKSVRNTAYLLGIPAARALGAPIDYPVIVTLVWEVTDRRVRDASGPAPTAKACVDGLVDAGVLLKDRHEVVVGEDCRIEFGPRRGVRLEIRAVAETQDADSRPPAASQADSGVARRVSGCGKPAQTISGGF